MKKKTFAVDFKLHLLACHTSVAAGIHMEKFTMIEPVIVLVIVVTWSALLLAAR